MLVQTRHLSILICAVLVCALVLAGCCSECATHCTPNGLWQSPTMQATRSLLLVNTRELRILSIDGKKMPPSRIGSGEVREYYLSPGEHTIMATFRYGTPLSEGVLGDVHGKPLTLWHDFEAGHEYVAIYREHLYPISGAHLWTEVVETNVLDPQDLYWSLHVADLASDEFQDEMEMIEAEVYCGLVRGPNGPLAQAAESSYTY